MTKELFLDNSKYKANLHCSAYKACARHGINLAWDRAFTFERQGWESLPKWPMLGMRKCNMAAHRMHMMHPVAWLDYAKKTRRAERLRKLIITQCQAWETKKICYANEPRYVSVFLQQSCLVLVSLMGQTKLCGGYLVRRTGGSR